MIRSLFICLFLCANATISIAQTTRQADDALLLDHYQNQRFAEALTYLKTIYTEPVTDLKELSRLAYTSSMARMLPEAEGYYRRMYQQDSTSRSVLYNLASINQRRGNNKNTELYFKKLVIIDTNNFNAYNQLAQLSRDKSDLENEILYFEKANKINPTDADVAYDLSDAYILTDKSPKAETVLAIAIAADPENILLQQALLKLNYVESKWKETVKVGEQLLLLGDSTTNTVAKLGRAYYQTKNYTCGIATFLSIPEMDQTENSAYYTAICYKMLKDQKKAIQYLNKAISLSISTGTGAYYSEMADSYELQKQYKKAEENYQKSLLYDPKPLANYYLAVMYDTEVKNKKSALKYYKRYVAGKPDKKQQQYINYSMARIADLAQK